MRRVAGLIGRIMARSAIHLPIGHIWIDNKMELQSVGDRPEMFSSEGVWIDDKEMLCSGVDDEHSHFWFWLIIFLMILRSRIVYV